MSCVPVPTAKATKEEEACANCGKGGGNTIKLKKCNACYLVKYCSVDCQKIHRKFHKKACKERAAQLKDEKLYGQGHERSEGDFCPLCLLAIPFAVDEHSGFYTCCMKRVCTGCIFATVKQGLGPICPFCRAPQAGPEAENDEETLRRIQKRVAARDPDAICRLGDFHLNGQYGLEKSQSRAFELWSEAAELGSTTALCKLGMAYYDGDKGLSQDKAKGICFFESAAMQGCADSRSNLALAELEDGNDDRAVRHFMIAAKMGHKPSLDVIKGFFRDGFATRAQYCEALKGYQGAMEEMKSPDRDIVAALPVGWNL